MYLKILLTISLLLISPLALAAPMVPWKSYLGLVMLISLAIASFLSMRSEKADSRMGKLLLTGLYFWVLTFAQLIVLAFIYYFKNKFN